MTGGIPTGGAKRRGEEQSRVSVRASLSLRNIVKRFGDVVALDGASLDVRPGTIHALLGENGAGKTTMMRVAFGMVRPDAGEILVADRSVRFATPADAIAAGLGVVHQHYMNIPALTVAENVALGGRGRFDRRAMKETVGRLAADTGFDLDPDQPVESLSVSAQQRLEIIKALAHRASILLLDEPTAVLAPSESEALMQWLRRFVATGGTAVLITHRLAEAMEWADDITVLRLGRTIRSGAATDFDTSILVRAIVGEDLELRVVDRAPGVFDGGKVVARLDRALVRDQRGTTPLHETTLEVRAGEIVGVAGVDRSGYAELLRLLSRRVAPSSGRVMVPDVIGFIPEDRQRDGLIAEFSLTENVALRGAAVRRGMLSWPTLTEQTRDVMRASDVRGGTEQTRARHLSGGNQQRLVVGRELSDQPTLVVAENPTRGLDVRSTAAVHTRLRDAARAGAAIVVYSSDLDEVMALATRVCVLHNGRLVEVANDRAVIGRALLGLAS